MEMSKRKRFWFVLSLVAAVAAIAVLAGGLATLDLDYERQLIPSLPREAQEPSESPLPIPGFLDRILGVVFVVSAALLPFAIIYYLVSPEGRKQAVRDFIAMLILALPLYLLSRVQPKALETSGDLLVSPLPSQDLPSAPEVGFTPSPAAWLTTVAIVGIALLLAVLLVGIVWAVWRRRKRPPTSLEKLAQEAEDAVEAIEAGADLKDTVTQCYYEMVQVLKEERGIQRQQAMTPREFEMRLEGMGIPTTQVRRLTRLFEEVRYGDKQLGEQQQRQAIISLTSIVRFCRSGS